MTLKAILGWFAFLLVVCTLGVTKEFICPNISPNNLCTFLQNLEAK